MPTAPMQLLSTQLARRAGQKGNDGLIYYESYICNGTALIKTYVETCRR